MKSSKDIERLAKNIRIKKNTVSKDSILAGAQAALKELKETGSTYSKQNVGKIIMKSKIAKLAVAAVIFIAVMFLINYPDTSIDGASTAFAAAIDRIIHARTFSCTTILEMTYPDSEIIEGKYLFKQQLMFKEPDLERVVTLPSKWPKENIEEITITDYSNRQELIIRSAEKTATLRDMNFSYSIDAKTGELKLTELDTSIRDQLIEMSLGIFDDMGHVELDGQSVLMFQSEKNGRITTVWIDPATNLPVQFEQKWPDNNPSLILYTSIQIDTELDDELFSLEPPEGYDLKIIDADGWTDYRKKLVAKIKHLGVRCLLYAHENNNQFPSKFEDLVTSGIIAGDVLNKVLASPDEPNGPPIFQCQQADISGDPSIEVMLNEVYEESSIDDQVVVGFLDGHSELIPVKVLEQILKPWPDYKKKLVFKMSYLHWGCVHFSKEHDGEYPMELADLAGGEFSEDTIKLLQAAPGQPDGPAAIQYIPPRADTDTSTAVVFFEIYDEWPDDGIIACFADGHCEVVTDQNHFEELIK